MKKVLAMIAVSGLVSCSFAQGLVNFANSTTVSPASTNAVLNYQGTPSGIVGATTGSTFGKGTAPNGYYYALLMQSYSGTGPLVTSTLANVLTSGWNFEGMGTNSLAAGGFGGGGAAVLPTASYAAAGADNQFLVVGWSAGLGSTWSQVSAALGAGTLAANNFIGISSTGWGVAGTSSSETLFGTSGTGIQSPIVLYSTNVPEPTTMALVGLGGAAMLAFRRKNK